MRKNLLILFLCASFLGLYAQTSSDAPFSGTPSKAKFKAPSAVSEGQYVIGYCTETIDGNVGTNSANTLSAAIQIPTSRTTILAGNQIKKIRFGLNVGTLSITNVSVFIRTSLTGTGYTQAVSSVVDGWNEVTLTTPYDIVANQNLYIGYVITTSGGYPIGTDRQENNAYAGNIAIGSNWTTLAVNNIEGNLSIQAILEGNNLPQYDVQISAFSLPEYGRTGDFTPINYTVTNQAVQTITSFKLSYQVNNGTPVDSIVTTSLAQNQSSDHVLNFYAPAFEGEYSLKLTISDLNGTNADLTPADNESTTSSLVAEDLAPRRIVGEEATGTWCGFCPRGAVAMEYMKENYPNTFIGIAVHNNDPMVVSAYDNGVGTYISNYPLGLVNRMYTVDPGYFKTYYDLLLKESVMDISATANFSSVARTVLNVNTEIWSNLAYTNANYKLIYVLTENNVTGTTSGYAQSNYYAGGGYGAMGGYENLPATVPASQMVYNDVARYISGFTGVANSIPTTLDKMVKYPHSYQITIPSNVNDISEVDLVVMVYDAAKAKIANAVRIPVANLPTNVDDASFADAKMKVISENSMVTINDEFTSATVYDLTGKSVATLTPQNNSVQLVSGVYIVKATVGAELVAKKVVVK